MRKYIWKSVFMAFIMTWMGCAQDAELDVSDTDSALAPGEVLVKLTLSPEVETRAPRPLAWPTITGNRVDKVKLFFYANGTQLSGLTIKDETGKGLTHNSGGWGGDGTNDGSWILEWNKSSEDRPYKTKDEDTDGNQSVVLRVTGLTEGENYEIRAYGYSNGFVGKIENVGYSFTCTYDDNYLKYGIEEVFSGSTSFIAKSEIIPEVRLTRDVAGFMACLYNVPNSVKSFTITKYRNNQRFYLYFSDYNGINDMPETVFDYEFTIPENLSTTDDGIYVLNDYIFPDDMYYSENDDIREALKTYLENLEKEDPKMQKCFFVSFFMVPDSELSNNISVTFGLNLKRSDNIVYNISFNMDGDIGFKIKRNHFYYAGTPYTPINVKEIINELGGEA